MDNLHIFLGATVADAAARPLHWVYDPKKLNQYIKGKKEIAFLKKNHIFSKIFINLFLLSFFFKI